MSVTALCFIQEGKRMVWVRVTTHLVGGFNPSEKYYGLLRFMRRHGGSERPPHPSELRTLRVIADKVKPRQNLYEMPAGAPLIQKHENQP